MATSPARERIIRTAWEERGSKQWDPTIHGRGLAPLNMAASMDMTPERPGHPLPLYDNLEFRLVTATMNGQAIKSIVRRRGSRDASLRSAGTGRRKAADERGQNSDPAEASQRQNESWFDPRAYQVSASLCGSSVFSSTGPEGLTRRSPVRPHSHRAGNSRRVLVSLLASQGRPRLVEVQTTPLNRSLPVKLRPGSPLTIAMTIEPLSF
jgi:hypothetical protein